MAVNTQYESVPMSQDLRIHNDTTFVPVSQDLRIHNDTTIDKVTQSALNFFKLSVTEIWEFPHIYVKIKKALYAKKKSNNRLDVKDYVDFLVDINYSNLLTDENYRHLAQIKGNKHQTFRELFQSDESLPFDYPENGDFSTAQKQYLAKLYWEKYIKYEDSDTTYNPKFDYMYTWVTGETPPVTNPIEMDFLVDIEYSNLLIYIAQLTSDPLTDENYRHLAQIKGNKHQTFRELFQSDESLPFDYPENGDFSTAQKRHLAKLYWEKYIKYEDSDTTYNPKV